ncbi:TetR/AcrR family transcriptional regulator [Kibdelosporangium aridum]|uniref:TetR/AcrR family transcriptional regulator n=1 Tax=Kibdelosporangium aridum TaxID=2030 RepID=A0A428ZJB8_KIBAR|nr:TetR/AcrR family transcriptional regulator [Kibdelosporangium aridum]RSM88048.1 TetR/AcrR family transcriptional regulator [Kibdelosporangium aridum]
MPNREPQRSDAQANRTRILEVARDMLTEDGDASLNSIAKKAGVGAGTLYRHFPNREALVLAVYRHEVQRLVDWATELLAEDPPLVAMRKWFERLAGYIRIKRGLGDALTAANHDAITNETYGPVIKTIAMFLHAGEQDHTIRPGLNPDDVLLMMGAVWRTPAGQEGENQASRLLDLILEAFRA